jgi:hypothetical protein
LLKDVGGKLMLTNQESIKRWLRNNNVQVRKIGKNNTVFEIDVDCAIDTLKVREIRAEYPEDWEERYRLISKDQAVYKMVVLNLNNDLISRKPTTKIELKNDEDMKLLYELMK